MTRRCYAHEGSVVGRGAGFKTYQVTSEANTTAMSAVVIVSRIDGGLSRRISAPQSGRSLSTARQGSTGYPPTSWPRGRDGPMFRPTDYFPNGRLSNHSDASPTR